MKKKRILLLIVVTFVIIAILIAVVKTKSHNDNELGSYEFVQPSELVHITTVPDGYIGIYSANDLQNISKNTKANYIIMNDIEFNGINFSAIDNYSGIFDGNNYIIKNFKSDSPMFREISNATIKNVHLENSVIDRRNSNEEDISIGGIVGSDSFKTTNTIINCTYQGEIIAYGGPPQKSGESAIDAGGIIGTCTYNTSIVNCAFNGTIQIFEGYIGDLGGIVGYLGENCSPIENCYSIGEIIVDNAGYIGGICGSSDANINNCYSTINITVNDEFSKIGGIAGTLYDGNGRCLYYIGNIDTSFMYETNDIGSIFGVVYSNYDNINQIQYCYYNSEILEAVGGGTPYANVSFYNTEDLKKSSSFIGFDFNAEWSMGNKEYPYPILKTAVYTFPNIINSNDYSSNSEKSNNTNINLTQTEIENAFVQSVIKNSIDEIKPYFYPTANDILNNAYNKGEDNSVLADLHCALNEFYNDVENPLGNNINISKKNFDLSSKEQYELTNQILDDIYETDKNVQINSIEYSEFKYSTDEYSNSCTLIMVDTTEGTYLLAIDY